MVQKCEKGEKNEKDHLLTLHPPKKKQKQPILEQRIFYGYKNENKKKMVREALSENVYLKGQ